MSIEGHQFRVEHEIRMLADYRDEELRRDAAIIEYRRDALERQPPGRITRLLRRLRGDSSRD